MATIIKRVTNKGTKYQVQVRKKGHQPVFKSFLTLKDARTYAKETEARIERSVFQCGKDAETLLFGELAERYLTEVLVHKKGYDKVKIQHSPSHQLSQGLHIDNSASSCCYRVHEA